MAEKLMFTSAKEAQAAADRIWAAMLPAYEAAGRTLDGAKVLSRTRRGVDKPAATGTTGWDEPKPGDRGGWWIWHPEKARILETADKRTRLAVSAAVEGTR